MILRWIKTLSGRLTLFIVLALVTAQVLGIIFFVDRNERERDALISEGFVRQVAEISELYNAVPALNHEEYLRTVRQPGQKFWIAAEPAVRNPSPASETTVVQTQPDRERTPPNNWYLIASDDKRAVWYPDTRPFMVRYKIAPAPIEQNFRRRAAEQQLELENAPALAPGAPMPPRDEALSMEPFDILMRERQASLAQIRNPPPDGLRPGLGPPPQGARPDGPLRPDVMPGGPGEPRVRWRVSVRLRDGQWLNAEHLYQLGLPPWLSTVLFQNGVILVLMLVFVVPVIALATKRLTLLARAADKVGRGEDTEPLPESGALEIRQLTQAFNNMSLRLRRFVQGRTQMLAGISHDLRTPITALRLRTELVDDDENRERMLALIDDMHHLTEATLTLARDDSFTEKSDKVDLSSLIEGICDDLTDAGIDATANVSRGISLMCRPHSLRRAIRNLAENGAKYGKRARISLADTPAAIEIIIDDDGPGIPEDQMEKAFQPFVRLEGSRSRETGGSGLGLAITRSIILNHGGDISLVNRPEGGLRATITLPKPKVD